MKKTAWYDNETLPESMVSGVLGKNGWPKLEDTDHFKILKELIDLTDFDTICDVGCGGAELGRIYKTKNYHGYDLPHIIEKVGKVVNPNLNYHEYEAHAFNYTEFQKYDLIVCNGFLSEFENVLEILKNILDNTSKYLIIHRQLFNVNTYVDEYETYSGLKTPRSNIGQKDFEELLINHEIVKEINSSYGKSVLIKRK